MTARVRTLTIVAILGFVAFLLWATLSSQRAECAVTVEFHGDRRTATASAAAETEAAEQAQTAACGPDGAGHEREHRLRQGGAGQPQCRTL